MSAASVPLIMRAMSRAVPLATFAHSCRHRTFLRAPGVASRDRSLTKQQVVLYPRSTIFAAVSTVDAYQEFLPWCRSSRVLDRQPSSYKQAPDSAEVDAEVLKTEIEVVGPDIT